MHQKEQQRSESLYLICYLYVCYFVLITLGDRLQISFLRVRSYKRRNELKPVSNFILVENLTRCSVSSLLVFFTCYLNWEKTKLKPVWISYQSFWLKWSFKSAWDFHVNKIYQKRNYEVQTRWILPLMGMCVWNLWSFWQKWNFIYGDKIACKHYPKWNACACPSKYWVILKYSRNETSC